MAEETTNTTTQQGAEGAQQTAAAANTEASQQQAENKGSDLEALIQKAVDRATNKLGNENKKLRNELEAAKKAGMDAEELKKFELSEKEKEIAERERALTEKENRMTALKEIKAIGLDDGSEAALAIIDFVMAEDEAAIKERVKTFDALVKRLVQSKVDGVFKANGRTPGVGTEATGGSGKEADSLAVRMGKNAAQIDQKARNVRDHYLGGK